MSSVPYLVIDTVKSFPHVEQDCDSKLFLIYGFQVGVSFMY